MNFDAAPPAAGSDAAWVAALLAVNPLSLGGVVLRGSASPEREAWLRHFRALLPGDVPWRRVPSHVDDERLLGGLDVAASLRAGQPMVATGLLAEAHGGVLQLSMAERLRRGTGARICAALDQGEVQLQRDGVSRKFPANFVLLAQDEGTDEDENTAPELTDRLAFKLFLDEPANNDLAAAAMDYPAVAAAQKRLPAIACSDEMLRAIAGTSLALGVDSLRGALLTKTAAITIAALEAAAEVLESHVTLAVRLVLVPRATQWPSAETAEEEPLPEEEAPPEPEEDSAQGEGATPQQDDHLADRPDEAPVSEPAPEEIVLEAIKAALPEDLLAKLQASAARARSRGVRGRYGASVAGRRRGRPIGVRQGEPKGGQRLNVAATLKAAAPWQKLRQAQQQQGAGEGQTKAADVRRNRLLIRAEDMHVARMKARQETVTLFVVDASGSSAMQRLAEAKGAIELLLAECYVRRDQAALIAFKGSSAEVVLAPTRALARARRELAALPGGGGTPLALGLDTAYELASDIERRGMNPVLVVMTDGRGNVARDGTPGHERAQEEAMVSAQRFQWHGWNTLVVDTAARPRPRARELASAMGAMYLPLPQADAGSLSAAVQSAMAA